MPVASSSAIDERWWRQLDDETLDSLVGTAMASSPTIDAAIAQVDEADAALGSARALGRPQVGVNVQAAHVTNGGSGSVLSGNGSGGSGSKVTAAGVALGTTMSWEVDMWGRLRASTRAARSRITARDADLDAVRLSIAARVADTTLALGACRYSISVRDAEITSRQSDLKRSRLKLAAGSIAPTDVAASESNLASAETARYVLAEQCTRYQDAIAALTGISGAVLQTMITGTALPRAPRFVPQLPACVLRSNPAVVAAEREAAARWYEIDQARAARLPRINLAAALTGQWITALGQSATSLATSVGPTASGALIDGGSGTAQVRSAQARYREALAQLRDAVRTSAQAVEDALAARQSASSRIATAHRAAVAAQTALRADIGRWQAGAISQFELEQSRRQSRTAEEQEITAMSDDARAWVELVRATGPVTARMAATSTEPVVDVCDAGPETALR